MTPAEKAKLYPAELQPNPSYRYEPPIRAVINGVVCIEYDAGVVSWAADIARRGATLKFPKVK